MKGNSTAKYNRAPSTFVFHFSSLKAFNKMFLSSPRCSVKALECALNISNHYREKDKPVKESVLAEETNLETQCENLGQMKAEEQGRFRPLKYPLSNRIALRLRQAIKLKIISKH